MPRSWTADTAMNAGAGHAEAHNNTAYEDEANTFTAANTFSVANTWSAAQTIELRDKGGAVYNVKASTYGAAGDGTTDDTVPINAAITACNAAGGGVVEVPEGTFTTTGLTTKSNVWLRGAGKGSTTIQLRDGADADVITCAGSSSRMTISDLTVDGNKANQTATSRGMALTSSTYVEVRNCRFLNTRNQALFYWTNTDCAFIENEVEDCGMADENGVVTASIVERIRIIGNRITNPGSYGIIIGGANNADIVIADNIIDGVADNYIGIALGAATTVRVSVQGNVVKVATANTGANCIDTGAAHDVAVHGNVCSGGRTGIDVDGGSRQCITGNVCYDNGTAGISAVGSGDDYDIVISGNMVYLAGTNGIAIDGVPNGVISNNLVKNSSQAAGTADAGIVVRSTAANATGVVITGNRCYDDQVPKTQTYGIEITGAGTTGNLVLGNNVSGNLTAGISAVAGNTLRENIGYVTRNYGATSVADSGTIDHGLAAAPTRVNVTCTTADEYASVSAVAAGNFTVQLTKHDGTAGTEATVYWEAEI